MSLGPKPSLLPLVLLAALAQNAALPVSAASIRVKDIELFSRNGATELQMTANGQLTYRVAIDQEDARVRLQLPNAEVPPQSLPNAPSGGLVRDLRRRPSDEGPLQLVLDLSRPAEALVTAEGNGLSLVLKPTASVPSPPESRTAETAPSATDSAQIRDFSLDRNKGKTRVLVTIEGDLKRFRSFQLADPPRVVVDLFGAQLALDRTEHAVAHPAIERLRFGQKGNRVRMILDLRKRMIPTVRSVDAGLRVALTAPDAQEGMRQVTGIDFTTGPEEGMGRLILQLDRTGIGARVRRGADRVIMDLPRTQLPERFQKRLVVTDFGTVVDTIDLYQKGERARIVATGDGPLRPRTYQVGNRLVLDIAEPRSRLAKRGTGALGKPYEGDKLSLSFQGIQVRQALQILAKFAQINIIASESVGGNLTMRLQDVPWDQALDLILESQGLGMKREGNVVWVAPQAELQKRRQQKLKAKLQKQRLVPLQTEIIQVNYAKASEMKALLESQQGGNRRLPGQRDGRPSGQRGMLSERGSVSVDPRTNSLLVRDTPKQIQKVRDLVEKLDKPTRQVRIEARIVSLDTDFERNLGVRWGGLVREGSDTIAGSLAGAQGNEPALAVNLPTSPAPDAALGARIGSLANDATLDLELSAIEAEGKGRVISSPRVVTADQQEATIQQGTEIPFEQATSSGATSISFQEAELSLSVTPQITPEDHLIMEVNAKNDTVGETTPAGPAIDTEEIETQVLVDDGETIVLGGIYTKSERTDETGVPFFRNIPGLGWLFKTKTITDEKRELLIFLTPRIIKEALGGRASVTESPDLEGSLLSSLPRRCRLA